MRAYSKIAVSHDGPVCRITLNAPERRNAIGPVMVNELLHALSDARDEAAVRVVVLTGSGKAFCAGGDFQQMTAGGDVAELPFKGDYADLLLAMTQFDKPVVARVNGAAMGGGLGLVAASAFAIAQSDAALGTPEINVGLFPMMIMAVLVRVVPRRKLLEMMLTGDRLTADEALAAGLVNRVVAPDALDAAVDSLVAKLASKSPKTLALGLNAFAAQDDLDLAAALPMLRARLAECLATDDAREGLMAFVEKRTPVWTGK